MLTIFNVNDNAFGTIDCGKKRTLSDIYALQGEVNYSTLASAAAFCYREECGSIYALNISPENYKAGELIRRHAGLRDSVAYILRLYRGGPKLPNFFPVSTAAYLHYAFARKDKAAADDFFDKLFTGEDLRKTHPVGLVRNRLLADMAAKAHLPRQEKMGLVVQAWNCLRDGQTHKKILRTARGANGKEKYPVIK